MPMKDPRFVVAGNIPTSSGLVTVSFPFARLEFDEFRVAVSLWPPVLNGALDGYRGWSLMWEDFVEIRVTADNRKKMVLGAPVQSCRVIFARVASADRFLEEAHAQGVPVLPVRSTVRETFRGLKG